MKRIIVFLLIALPFILNASIYDYIKNKNNFSMGFVSREINKMNFKINGNKMTILLLETNKSSKDVLEKLFMEAEKDGCHFYSNETVLYIATILYKIAGKKKYEDEFGYIFYKDKKNNFTFTITAGNGTSSEIIKITSNSFNNGKWRGVNDGIRHISGVEKILSIEILSELGYTVHFANFYMSQSNDRYEIRNYYNYSLKNSGFRIIKKYFDDNIDFFILQKQSRNYLLSISEERGENWIMVMG